MQWQDGGVPGDSAQNHVTTRVRVREAEQGKTLEGSFQKAGSPRSRGRGGGEERGGGGRERRRGEEGTQGETKRRGAQGKRGERGSRGRGQDILTLEPIQIGEHEMGPGGLPSSAVLGMIYPVNIQSLEALFPSGKPAWTGVSPAGEAPRVTIPHRRLGGTPPPEITEPKDTTEGRVNRHTGHMASPAVDCVENAHNKGGLRALRKQFTTMASSTTKKREEVLIPFPRLSRHTTEKSTFESFASVEEGLAEGPTSRANEEALMNSSVQTVNSPTGRDTRASQLCATSEEMLLRGHKAMFHSTHSVARSVKKNT